MEVVYECCCGLDVNAKTVVACVITKGRKEIRTFGTMTEGLLHLGDWLTREGCTHVAIESTGGVLESGVQPLSTQRPKCVAGLQ